MAGYSTTNWGMYLRLIGLGMQPKDAVTFVGVSIAAPYVKANRDAGFKALLAEASQLGHQLRIVSPLHWVDERGLPILDGDFEPIPRDPPSRLLGWLRRQRNPLAMLAG